ncbi:Hypothetical protein, predicted lipoprotein [Metamycoplasma alkalescens 14918]|uniref:Tail specific protease domain-containing protein n=1 Tax=Metamycoplasma alkalescens 14918 TaxID=1188234 RepID=N9SRF9_9BACT|nr:S41 family peptidase [Metamycoplasma alkalescens]ENY54050.1 Hypothetical protein, predicted lipoprotein [Metamycoplasma alkalescens 14918]
MKNLKKLLIKMGLIAITTTTQLSLIACNIKKESNESKLSKSSESNQEENKTTKKNENYSSKDKLQRNNNNNNNANEQINENNSYKNNLLVTDINLTEFYFSNLTNYKDEIDKQKKKISLHIHNDIPYIGIKEFLESTKPILKNVNYKFNNNTVTLSNDKDKLIIDFDKNKIFVSNYKFFTDILKFYKPGEEDLNIIFKNKNIEKSSNNPIEFNLSKYNIDILSNNKELYLPLTLLNQMLLNESNIQLYFNNETLFLFDFAKQLASLPRQGALKWSPKANNENIPNKLKEFQHNYLGFLFDYYYGIKKDNNSYKEYFQKYKNDILKDNNTHYLTIKKIINELDDPHSAYIMDGYFKKDNNLINKLLEYGERTKNKENLEKILADKLPWKTSYINNFIDDNHQTSVISFKSFDLETTKHIKKFLDEAKQKNTKNIIFDLSLNYGGFIGAGYELLGFLTNESFNVYSYNSLSKEKIVKKIKSKLPKYDFNYYFLISPYSFSAGNILPQIIKDNNLGKVIGYKSFGGASAITYSILPTGDIIQISSNHVFTNKNYQSLEFGVEPDIKFDGNIFENPEKIYDLSYIKNVINKNNNSK